MNQHEQPAWRRYLRFWGPDVRADVDDEMNFHIEHLVAEYMAEGYDESTAARMARERFGDYGGYEQACREIGRETETRMQRKEFAGTFFQDVRFGLRQLRSNALLSLTAILTLALGIGANTTIFSVVNTVLLRPLPYHNAERIVVSGMSYPDFRDMQQRNHVFEDMTVWASNLYTIRGDSPDEIRGAIVNPNFFTMLASPVLGHGITESEQGTPVAVISDGLWRRRFNASRNVLGQSIDLSGKPHTIIGVMPASFQYPDVTFDVWVPLPYAMQATPLQMENRSLRIFKVVSVLKPGIALQTANSDVAVISQQLQAQYPTSNQGVVFQFQTLSSRILGTTIPLALRILLGAVGMVLLIACVNVANLLLGLTSKRSREIAVRRALGAPRTRLLRQLLTESLVLALVGGAAGVAVAAAALNVLPKIAVSVPRINEVTIDMRVLLYALAASCITALLFGIMPAFQGSRTDLRDVLQEGGRGGIGAHRGGVLRNMLVATEVALSVVVLVGAGLLTQSLMRVMNQDIGIKVDNLVSANTGLFYFTEPAERTARLEAALERIKAVQGVEIVGASSGLPPQSGQRGTNFTVPGRTPDAAEANGAFWIANSPDYFRAVGAAMKRGREFDAHDAANGAPVAIINETLATTLFGNTDPIGRQIQLTNPEAGPAIRTIVGVAPDIRYGGIEDATAVTAIYTPFAQTPFLWANLMVRTATPATRIARPLREALAAVDPRMVPGRVQQHGDIVSSLYAQRRFITLLLGSFALLALVLAAVGIYGVIANSVLQRRREIGVRIALGAQPRAVLREVIARALLLVTLGLSVGILASMWLTRLLATLLYGGVTATNPTAFATGALIMTTVAVVASGIPAWRAARLDPLLVLRE
jgi:predicted permease